ncbi:hypothetical protein MACH09_39830 [Vibrio sp. MACH09]|uniref:OadG family protein n=1 Tax=unclassified Vibrio TaxID=2614977 RepID=UPI0014932F02|nr:MULTISPECIES: OadG family transporter subunit [unclassified Vibrio]NOI67158.1 sodium pump decarboxylase subunit gamma [Vibrio sp. 99-8-1]GLO63475.1 hypothetical protein MACH09_39830 [Vibrio sp. MACH09]
MSESPIILEGVTLMLLGMGFVFFFLVLLVGATRLLSTVANKIQSNMDAKTTPSNVVENASEDTVVAAISAALHHHKQKISQQA